MGDNIKKLLAKFDEGLSLAISKQEENDKTFKSTRDSALKIADARIGIWPSDASVKTIGDLLGYVFPISGGVKNEPTMTYPVGGMTPEGDGYQQDMKSSSDIKSAYNDLKKYYNTAAKYSLPKLKEKGGGQFWFDYYMYYLIDFYLKNAEFVKLVKTDFEGPGEMSKLLTGDGSSIKHYSNFEIFDEIIVIDSKYNSNNGLHRYLTYNLASAIVKDAADDLLFQAIIEAGDSYSGPYTNDIKASKKSLVELLEITPPPENKKDDKKDDKPAVPANKEAVPTDNGVVKLKVALRGIQDGFQIRAKSDIPNFSIYAGDPDKDWPLLGVAIPEDGEDFDDIDGAEQLDEEYIENKFSGFDEFESEEQGHSVSVEDTELAAQVLKALEKEPIIQSKWKLDLIPDTYQTNSGERIQVCQIDGKPVNAKIAPYYLDMVAAAKADGIEIKVNSGFRSPEDPISTKSASGVPVSAQSQRSLWNDYIAKKPGANVAAEPPKKGKDGKLSGGSNHGSGIAVDLNCGGASSGRKVNLNKDRYVWLVKNSWKYGFVRGVAVEEWHYDYLPDKAKKGPYGKISGTDTNKFYSDWGLDKITIT